MKFNPIILATLAVFAFGCTGCGVKSAKASADEARQLDAEAAAIANDLYRNHSVVVLVKDGNNAQVQAFANNFPWANKPASEREIIRQKLNQLAGKIDAIFKIDRRKDVKVTDPAGNLAKARQNVDLYLNSLATCESNGICRAG